LTAPKPALILWADGDFAFKDEERRRFRAAFPNHRDVDLIGAGHFIQEDAPDEISAEIANWYLTWIVIGAIAL
jgi:haloalkane dehalogenase